MIDLLGKFHKPLPGRHIPNVPRHGQESELLDSQPLSWDRTSSWSQTL